MTSRAQRGFTLLEILVVIVVLGLLMTGLVKGVELGMRSWDKQSQWVNARDQLDSTDRTIRALIGQILPPAEGQDQAIDGQRNKLGFRTKLPGPVVLSTRLVNATLFVDKQHRLLLSWILDLHEHRIGPDPKPTETELLAGVERVEFSYWRPADENGQPGWATEWTGAAMPTLIKIHLIFPKGDRRNWPDIIAGPLLDPTGGVG